MPFDVLRMTFDSSDVDMRKKRCSRCYNDNRPHELGHTGTMTKETALIILALIILALPVICVYAWVVDMSDHNLNVLVAIQVVIYVGWTIHCKINFKE